MKRKCHECIVDPQRKRHRSSAALHNADAPVGVGMLAAFSAKLVVSKIWIHMIQKYKEENIDNGHNHICPLPKKKISTPKRFTQVSSLKHDGDSFMGVITSSTAQGGGGSFKHRKHIEEIGCCESGMAERIH